jgi:archaellum component FlaD/FlaE
MKINLELNGTEMLHSIRTGALESFIDNVNAAEKTVSDITMSTTPKTEKAEKPKTEKATPKKEEKAAPKVEEVQETAEEEIEEIEEIEEEEVVVVTLEELRAKFGKLIKAGKKAEVQAILESFEVARLTDLPESSYAKALAQAEKL